MLVWRWQQCRRRYKLVTMDESRQLGSCWNFRSKVLNCFVSTPSQTFPQYPAAPVVRSVFLGSSTSSLLGNQQLFFHRHEQNGLSSVSIGWLVGIYIKSILVIFILGPWFELISVSLCSTCRYQTIWCVFGAMKAERRSLLRFGCCLNAEELGSFGGQ